MNRTRKSKLIFLTRLGLRFPFHAPIDFRFPVYGFIGLLLGSFAYASPFHKISGEIGEPTAPESTLVCVVSGEGDSEMNMDAVVMVQGGKLKAPYVEDNEAAQQRLPSWIGIAQ